MIMLHTNKGTRNFVSASEAASWLEEVQPSSVDVSLDDSSRVTIDCEDVWDADEAEGIIENVVFLLKMDGVPIASADCVKQVAAEFGVDASTARNLIVNAFDRN